MKKIFFFVLIFAGYQVNAQQTTDTAAPQFIPIVSGFYNLENLFDTINNPKTNDEEFLPGSAKKYNTDIYYKKLHNLAYVLSQIGTDVNPEGLAFFASSEVENETVLNDLIKQKEFEGRKYKAIVTQGPDPRGINVSLVYSENYFAPISIHTYDANVGYPTRDILYVKGILVNEPVHIFVNHWPSRRGSGSGRNYIEETAYFRGLESSRPGTNQVTMSDRAFTGQGGRISDGHGQLVTWNALGGNDDGEGNAVYRIAAAKTCRTVIDSIMAAEPGAKIIVMGDMNDNPNNPSMSEGLRAKSDIADLKANDIYNPYFNIHKMGVGTLAWNGKWDLFDQLLFSQSMTDQQSSSLFLYKSHIFLREFLLEDKNARYRGYPKRTWSYDTYNDGYSDHLPSYCILLKRM